MDAVPVLLYLKEGYCVFMLQCVHLDDKPGLIDHVLYVCVCVCVCIYCSGYITCSVGL